MRILGVVAADILIVPSVLVGTASVLERPSGPVAKEVVSLAESALPKLEISDFTVGARWHARERAEFVDASVHNKLKAGVFPTGAATCTTSHADRLVLRNGFTQIGSPWTSLRLRCRRPVVAVCHQ